MSTGSPSGLRPTGVVVREPECTRPWNTVDSRGVCPTCRATYRAFEFRIDMNGLTHLEHTCKWFAREVEPEPESETRSARAHRDHRDVVDGICVKCQTRPVGGPYSRYCPECRQEETVAAAKRAGQASGAARHERAERAAQRFRRAG